MNIQILLISRSDSCINRKLAVMYFVAFSCLGASPTWAQPLVKAPIRDSTCGNAAPYDITPSSVSACYATWKLRDGGQHYNYCISHGGTMQYYIVRWPSGQLNHSGYSCTYPSGGGMGVAPNYYCPSGAVPVEGMCPDAQPQLNSLPNLPKNYPSDYSCQKTSADQGNPINAATGLKHQTEIDYEGLYGLSFKRIYSSVGADLTSPLATPFGAIGWHLDWQRAISGNMSETKAFVMRSKGATYVYNLNSGVWAADADITAKLTRQTDAQGNLASWVYRTDEGAIERYNDDGKLASVTNKIGWTATLIYSNGSLVAPNGGSVLDASGAPTNVALPIGLLIGIQDTSGRSLRLGYDAQSRLRRMTDPGGGVYRYDYDSHGNLAFVTYPDNYFKQYNYENASYINALTGIIDEQTIRFATWAYDVQGRAVSSEHSGGVDKVVLTYNSDGGVSILDAVGSVRTQNFQVTQGIAKNAGISQPGGSGCAAASSALAYDSNGNVKLQDDFNGHRTCYANDLTRNLETGRIEGLLGGSSGSNCTSAFAATSSTGFTGLPAETRKISTKWHPDWALKVQQAEPYLLTTWVYNGQPDPTNGNQPLTCTSAKYGAASVAPLPDDGSGTVKPIAVLCKKVEQATIDATGLQGLSPTLDTSDPNITAQRQWSYQYNQYGQVLSSTGPEGTVTNTYYCQDNATCDGTNKYSFTGTAPNESGHYQGDLYTVTNAAGHTTTYNSYDRAGRVLSMTDPNGLNTTYTYWPRGWIKTVTQAGGLTTKYDYWPTGLLKKVTQPEGSTLSYAYDDAHRLTDVTDNLGNTVHYTLDNAGNRLGENVKDLGGSLTRNISRTFDALNRLQLVTGAAQ